MPVSSVHQDLRTRLPEDDAVPGRDQALGRGGGGGGGGHAAVRPIRRSAAGRFVFLVWSVKRVGLRRLSWGRGCLVGGRR